MAYPSEAFAERAAIEWNSVFKRGLGALPSTSRRQECECVLTLALLAGFVCGYPHALLAGNQNNRNGPCAAAENQSKFKY